MGNDQSLKSIKHLHRLLEHCPPPLRTPSMAIILHNLNKIDVLWTFYINFKLGIVFWQIFSRFEQTFARNIRFVRTKPPITDGTCEIILAFPR